MAEIRDMIGKEVEVMAGGMAYRGTLIEVSDSEVTIRTTLQWVSLPASSVGSVRLAEGRSTAVADSIIVDPRPEDR
jgi:hypothetical protein